jgi:hypothetical protein
MAGLDMYTLTRLQKIHSQEGWAEAEKQRLIGRSLISGRAEPQGKTSIPAQCRLLTGLGRCLVAWGERILDRYDANGEPCGNEFEGLIS